MSEKFIIVSGAICKCKFGTAPDKLVVRSHQKEYANDKNGSKKLIASTKDIGPATFQNNMFGSCSKMNNNPCKAVVQEWKDHSERITLTHGGKALREDSKAVCPIGNSPCIEIIWHGQAISVSRPDVKKSDKRSHAQMNPLIDTEAIEEEIEQTQYYH